MFFTLFVFVVVLNCKVVTAQVNVQDSLALVDLYNSTGGPQWDDNTNWLSATPVSGWYGIKLDDGGQRVKEISLNSNNLNGSLPESVGNLDALQILQLSNNRLGAKPLPASIGDLSALTKLQLSGCGLTGSIPPELGKLESLWVLKLNQNQLSGSIPATLSYLSMLEYMDLSENQLTGSIPPEFGNLAKVTYLSFFSNRLTGSIPFSLDTIPDLADLYLSHNLLTGPISPLLKRGTGYGMGNWRYIDDNKFTFEGTESIGNGTVYSSIIYAPQDTVLPLHFNGGILSVSAGGTLSNNTYRWYKDNQLMSTITGDSTFVPAQNGNYTVTVTNKVADKLTLFSDTFDVHTLPVTFLGFTAHLENSSALLNWQTAAEINSAWFNVQRSVGGGGFTTIDKIPAAGNSHKVMSYTYKDTDAAKKFSGRIYYRLQQVDKDGAVTNSKIIAVNPGAAEWNFTLTPNPATDEVQVSLNNMPGKTQLAIFNLNGQKVAYREITGAGSHKAVIGIAPLPAGVYVLQVFCNGQQKQQKFIKR